VSALKHTSCGFCGDLLKPVAANYWYSSVYSLFGPIITNSWI